MSNFIRQYFEGSLVVSVLETFKKLQINLITKLISINFTT